MTQPTTTSVWTQLSSDLRRFIRRRVADDHVADDLLQETFLRIHRSIDTLETADRLAAWVYRIARNVIHDHYRKSGPVVPSGEHGEPSAPPGPGAEPLALGCGWVEELIQQLPEGYREAIRLSEVEGLAQRVVADRLGLSLSGAKSRIQRGREMLKDVLTRCCSFEFDRRGNLMNVDPKPDRTVCRDCDGDNPWQSCSSR